MLRGTKSLLAIGALGAAGVALRWVTAGTITTANSHDLDSLTVLAVGTVAWVAYGWLVLAVLATALEHLPGAIGTAAGVLAARITSTTSRALLRSALGVAAVTPLTVGVAQAASPHGWPTPQAGAAHPAATWRTTEPQSSVAIGATRADLHATEPRSAVGKRVPVVGGVRVPDRPGAVARYAEVRLGRVTVAAGETLWGLAARELGVQATDREIGARWLQWYAANRQVIGADPNLIVPGQVLRVPPIHKEQ
ncbi:LysM peptidoglycan-binding domain-containing protein [Kribbella sp. NPDC056345]|uniref:LysM peptidoglycan-binding domain-containing protein n=1 Tax=Kribbella sp. NPDC056345 TaxID=3345789 RepID=UPI0035DCD51B